MTFLLDTNVFLELLLEREKADDVRRLFATLEPDAYAISDFSLHSIGVILTRMNRHDLLLEFIDDLIIETGMRVVGIPSSYFTEVVTTILRYRLDFDDAYQARRGRTVLAGAGQLRPALRHYADRPGRAGRRHLPGRVSEAHRTGGDGRAVAPGDAR